MARSATFILLRALGVAAVFGLWVGAFVGPFLNPVVAQEGGQEADPADLLNRRFQQVAEEVAPSVVQVLVDVGERAQKPPEPQADELGEYRHFFTPGAEQLHRGLGSGFMVSPAGLIVTNAHVVEKATRLTVRLADGRELAAELVGKSEPMDLAVLRIPSEHGRPLAWGDSSSLRPGAIVFALGSPFGLQNSISQGIVSGLGRRRPDERTVAFIQTDAAINQGNSGGPLVDLHGRVVGINTWIISTGGASEGVGFAIPANLGRRVVESLVAKEQGTGAWLGILPVATSKDSGGVEVYHAFPGSPADRAGVEAGDRIVSFDGEPVDSIATLRAILTRLRPGGQALLELARGRATVTAGASPQGFDPSWVGKADLADRRAGLADRQAGLADRQAGLAEELQPGPLSPDEKRAMAEALKGRDCPCPCGQTLANCFGCSEAKSEFSEAERLARLGLTASAIRGQMDPPVIATVWFDYTDARGRALVRLLDQLGPRLRPFFRVRRRYFPASKDELDPPAGGFRATVHAVETARAAGRYEAAHRFLLEESGETPSQRVKRLPKAVGVDPDDVRAAIRESRFEAQIQKDLSAGPEQYGVTGSPFLQFGRTPYAADLTLDALSRFVEQRIVEKSF